MDVKEKVAGDWVDITAQFRDAAQALPLGGLLHEDSFGLGEAMNAVEMMDTKMDAYCEENRICRKVLSFEEARKDHLKVSNFSPEEQLGIIDELLACLATWLNGHNLAQTVFTCWYVHDLGAVEDAVLKAACIGVLKYCAYVREVLVASSVHEDEDQQTTLYQGFDLLRDLNDRRAMASLKDVEADVSRQIRHFANPKSQSQPFTSAHCCTGANADNLDQVRALLVRIRFIKHLFGFGMHSENHQDDTRAEAKKALESALAQLPELEKTLHLGITRSKGAPKNALMLGFEPLVNERLLPPSPRLPRMMSRSDAIKYFSNLIPQLTSALEIVTLPSLQACLDCFWRFSWRRPLPAVVARSYLLHLYFMLDMKKSELRLKDSCRSFCNPPSLMPKVKMSTMPDVMHHLHEFFGLLGQALDEIVHVLCMQRSWHRQKLVGVMNKLATLQDQGEQLDLSFCTVLTTSDPDYHHNGYFSSYVLWFILQVEIHYVLLPFELELYSIDEYHYVFWYVEYLFGWMGGCFKAAIEVQKLSELAGMKGSKKAKTARKVVREKEQLIILMQGKQNLARGCLRVIEAMHSCGRMEKPKYPFGSEQTRFYHRFQALNTFDRPPALTHEIYKERHNFEALKEQDFAILMTQAVDVFKTACDFLEKVPQEHPEVSSLLKVAKTNTVVCKLLSSGHKRLDTTQPPQFDFSIHRHFPVVRPL